ncbi:MAG: peptidylprolyl isomerase [Gemmatales bacterium]|nr:peptidylprolyl isomerase [Gemmatales bacterium]
MLRQELLGVLASLSVASCASGSEWTLLHHSVRFTGRSAALFCSERPWSEPATRRGPGISEVSRGRNDPDSGGDPNPSRDSSALPLAQASPPSLPATPSPTLGTPAEGKTVLSTQALGGVLVRVNGEPILEEEVRALARWLIEEYVQRVRPASLNDEAERRAIEVEVSRRLGEVLEQLIDRELLYQEAEKRVPPRGMELVRKAAQQEIERQLQRRRQQMGFRTEDELREYLAQQRISLPTLRRQVERNLIAEEYLRTLIRPKFEQIDRRQLWDYYQRHLKKFEQPERVEWQYIFISAREGARHLRPGESADPAKARAHAEFVYALARQAKTPEEFSRLAEHYSDGPSRSGEGEGHDLQSIRPVELAELVWKTPPGQVGPLVPASDGRGYHIFRVHKHDPARTIPFEEACLEIRRLLQNEIFLTERDRILRELRAKAHIEYPARNSSPR